MSEFGWWAISGDRLLDMLRRVEAGESPDVVYTEEYANGHPEQVEPETREISGRLGRFLHNVVAFGGCDLCAACGKCRNAPLFGGCTCGSSGCRSSSFGLD